MDIFDFGAALSLLKLGDRVCRKGWNGKGMWLILIPQNSVELPLGGLSYPTNAYIAMKTVQNTIVPWLASQTDVLAEDWELFG